MAYFAAVAFVFSLLLQASSAALPLRCLNESQQLFPVNIELLTSGDELIFSSNGGEQPQNSSKICQRYLRNDEKLDGQELAWVDFDDLATVQFVLPNEFAGQVSNIHIQGPENTSFILYHQDQSHSSQKGSVTLQYPPKDSLPGDPIHTTVFADTTPSGVRLMAVWISFAKPADEYDCQNFEHCCALTDDLNSGFTSAACKIGPPQWKCFAANGDAWTKGQNLLSTISYLGPLANSPMVASAGGNGLLVHLAETADLSVPLTNTYAEHQVHDSAACQALCTEIQANPSRLSLFGLRSAANCSLVSGTAPAFKARNYGGRITVNGFGRISGERMMRKFLFKNATVWHDPAAHPLNAYGKLVPNFRTMADAEAHTRWRVMSGLLELSTHAQPDSAASRFVLDVSELTVSSGPKRGDGTIRLQFPRVPLGGAHNTVADSDQPASLFDVKTPGAWVGAADGPRVTASGSSMAFLYTHHSDDNLKIDSSDSVIRHITMLQGNIGAAIELGTYGIGLRDNEVRNASVAGVYIHRITHRGAQEDGVGSVLGSRTCPWAIRLLNISITDVYIAGGGGSNEVASLFKIGTYGAPSARFAAFSKLDRWTFCSNPWWLDSEHIVSGVGQRAVTLQGLTFANWTVRTKPANESWLYNFHAEADTVIDAIRFFDVASPDPLSGAIRIYPGDQSADPDYWYTPCFGALVGDEQGQGCWDKHGEIGSRRPRVCHGSCSTGLVVGTPNSTVISDIRFLHGNGGQ